MTNARRPQAPGYRELASRERAWSRNPLLPGLLVLLCVTSGCARDPGPGQVAPALPEQVELHDAAPLSQDGHVLLPLAKYEIEARVLSTERYRFDRGAQLSRLDLALGWGPMSDGEVLRHFDINQGFRLFTWRTRQFPIPREDVEAHAANVHVIAADRVVERKLRRLREGDVVRLEGFLVEARGPDGWTWRSSLTRHDTGDGSCELLLVKNLRVR